MIYNKSKEIFFDEEEERFYGYIFEIKSNEKFCTVWGKSKGVVGVRQDLLLGLLNKIEIPALENEKQETISIGSIVEFTLKQEKVAPVNLNGMIRYFNYDKTIATVIYYLPNAKELTFSDFKTSELTLLK